MIVNQAAESRSFSEPYFVSSQISPNGEMVAFSCLNYANKDEISIVVFKPAINEFTIVASVRHNVSIELIWRSNYELCYYAGTTIYCIGSHRTLHYTFPAKIVNCYCANGRIWVVTENSLYATNNEGLEFSMVYDKVIAAYITGERFALIDHKYTLVSGAGELSVQLPLIYRERINLNLIDDARYVFLSGEKPFEGEQQLLQISRIDLLTGESLELVNEMVYVGLGHPTVKWKAINEEEVLLMAERKGFDNCGLWLIKTDGTQTLLSGTHFEVFDYKINTFTNAVHISAIDQANDCINKEKSAFILKQYHRGHPMVCVGAHSHSFFSWSANGNYSYVYKDQDESAGICFYNARPGLQTNVEVYRNHDKKRRRTFEIDKCNFLGKFRSASNSAIIYFPGVNRSYSYGMKDLFFHYAIDQILDHCVNLGFQSFGINLPGAVGYGGEYRRAFNSFRLTSVPRIKSAIEHLKFLEFKKIVLLAGSIGTIPVLQALSDTDPDISVVLLSPVFGIEDEKLMRYSAYFDNVDSMKFIDTLSPGKVKMLIFYGLLDKFSDPLNISYLVSCKASNGNIEAVTLPNEHHIFKEISSLEIITNTISKFIHE